MRIKLLLLLLIISNVFGQWKYYSGANKIDGDYKTSIIIGKGPFPYDTPEFSVTLFNENILDFKITEIGYLGCGGRQLKFIFDDEHKMYEANSLTTDLSQKRLIVKSFYQLSISEFVKKLKTHSKMTVIYISDCNNDHYSFSLMGSSKALNFVLRDYFK